MRSSVKYSCWALEVLKLLKILLISVLRQLLITEQHDTGKQRLSMLTRVVNHTFHYPQ